MSTIEQLKVYLTAAKNDVNKDLKNVEFLFDVKTGRKTKRDIEKAMSITCHGDLAGCCSPEKECGTQLAVCEALGIDPQELFDMKKAAVDTWLKIEVLNK